MSESLEPFVGYTDGTSCNTTSCEFKLMMIWLIENEMASERSSINVLYSMILFVNLPIQIPRQLTNSSFGVKMAHAAEDRFCVLRLAPSAYPTNGSEDSDIYDEM